MQKNLIIALFSFLFTVGYAQEATLLDEVFAILKNEYVNPKKVDLDLWLSESKNRLRTECAISLCDDRSKILILKNSIKKIDDRHLNLSTKFAYSEDLRGVGDAPSISRYGFRVVSNSIVVISYIKPNSQADKKGLLVGDIILKANLISKNAASITKELRESEYKKQTIDLKIQRSGKEIEKQVDLRLERPWEPSYDFVNSEIAVFRIPDMYYDSELSDDETIEAITYRMFNKMLKNSPKKLILDLRANNGGDPFGAISIAGIFLDRCGRKYTYKNKDYVTFEILKNEVKYKNTQENTNSRRMISNIPKFSGKMVILVDNMTASAGENLADILQESGRARIVGEKTFGAMNTTAIVKQLSEGTSLFYSNTTITGLNDEFVDFYVKPDINLPLDVELLSQGRDNQIEMALRILNEK
jgi:carboxyl-terminal processing protease